MRSSQIIQDKQQKISKWILVTAILVITAFLLVWYFLSRPHNYAADAIAPIESALVEAGATRQCGRGDDGLGPDNRAPWYEVFYSIPKNEEGAVALLKTATSKQGFSLKRASVQDRGPVMVDEKFIDKWFYDQTSKSNTHTDLRNGALILTATVNADGDDNACEGKNPKIDDDHSVIGVSLKLPEYK